MLKSTETQKLQLIQSTPDPIETVLLINCFKRFVSFRGGFLSFVNQLGLIT